MLERVKNWLQQPFTGSMDAFGWALFVLFLIVVAYFWTRILNAIVEVA